MQSTAEILLRPARSEDAVALKAILYDTFESTWLPNITPVAAQAFRNEDRPADYVGRRGLKFWVAEQDGAVAGFIDWEKDFINALHVRRSCARRGIASRLMDLAEMSIGEAGLLSVSLETDTFNTIAQAFYAQRGYREVDRYPDLEWHSGLMTLPLQKQLC